MMTGQPRPTGQPPQPGRPEQAKHPPTPEGEHGFQRWAVLLIAAALIGGLAAAALTRESVLWAVVFSLVVATVALGALAGGLLDDAETPRQPPSKRRRPSRHSADQPTPARPDPAAPPLPRPGLPGSAGPAPAEIPGGAAPDADRVAPTDGRLPEPPRPASGGQPWWEQPGAAAAAPSAAPPADDRVPRHARLAAAKYADFSDQAQIAQCPRCGSFCIEVGPQATPPWHFACYECGRDWTWRPGIPWPPVQVRPNARHPAEKPDW